jgi:hypothetical protein
MLVRLAFGSSCIHTGLVGEDQLRVISTFEIQPIVVKFGRVEDPRKNSKSWQPDPILL